MPQSMMTKTFAKYLRMGIAPRTVRGNWKDGDYMYSLYHHDVQYTIDDMGDYEIDSDVTYILECLEARRLIISRHHEVIETIYNVIKSKLLSNVWVRVGIGQQLNCTFGDSRGEIANLLMDFVDPNAFADAINKLKSLIGDELGEDVDFTPAENLVLMISDKNNNFIFNGFSHPNVDIIYLDDIEGGHF